jgi:hypothetical protein
MFVANVTIFLLEHPFLLRIVKAEFFVLVIRSLIEDKFRVTQFPCENNRVLLYRSPQLPMEFLFEFEPLFL